MEGLEPFKVMVRPVVMGLSKSMEALGTAPLDEGEAESGSIAISMVLRQYGADIDPKVILLLWAAGVTLPRVVEYLDKQNRKPERTVVGEAKVVQPEGKKEGAA